ncbi:hypothetical protein [Oricola sp.]|uniref:hypothetical protein n=1 Tax=Oricola sp. TaxID=1979950 RepID=UPI003BAB8652
MLLKTPPEDGLAADLSMWVPRQSMAKAKRPGRMRGAPRPLREMRRQACHGAADPLQPTGNRFAMGLIKLLFHFRGTFRLFGNAKRRDREEWACSGHSSLLFSYFEYNSPFFLENCPKPHYVFHS